MVHAWETVGPRSAGSTGVLEASGAESTGERAQTPRVHIVDDDPLVLSSLVAIIEQAGFLAAPHRDAQSLLDAIAPDEFACVVLDMRLPGVQGLSLLRRLHDDRRELPVIMVSGEGDISSAIEALRCGAIDFLEKPVKPCDLIDRIVQAFHQLRTQLTRRQRAEEIRQLIDDLTPREHEVMEKLCAGLSVKKCAYDFGLSHKTVQVHRARILERMGVDSVVDLTNLVHEYLLNSGLDCLPPRKPSV